MKSVENLFDILNEVDEKQDGNFMSHMKLSQIFRMSQMTVFRDKRDSWKYEDLVFVEFLEMLCRVALSD